MTVSHTACGEFTVADLHATPDDGRRYELIGGSIIVSPAPLSIHQRVSRRLQRVLEDVCPPDHEVFNAPVGLIGGDRDEVQPDLVLVPSSRVARRGLLPPVPLVVELVSPGSARVDRLLKSDLYARLGVEHYWLLDTRDDQHHFEALVLEPPGRSRETGAGVYRRTFESRTRVDVDEPVPVHLDLEALFAGPLVDT